MPDNWLEHTLERIEKKLDKLNGSVSDLKNWKSRLQGAIAVLTLLVIPLVLYVAQQVIASE